MFCHSFPASSASPYVIELVTRVISEVLVPAADKATNFELAGRPGEGAAPNRIPRINSHFFPPHRAYTAHSVSRRRQRE